MEQALEGIRVIEISSYLAGPHAGMLLAELGAEVLEVEPLENDYARSAPGSALARTAHSRCACRSAGLF